MTETDFGFCGEAEAGSLLHVSKYFDVNVGISETVGSVKSSDLSGFGVNAGVRVPL